MIPELPLNEPQERRLTIVLARLESALRNLRQDALYPPASSPFTRCKDPIDPALTQPLEQAVGRAQTQVEQMASDLDLPAGTNPIRRAHLATFELLNIDLLARQSEQQGLGKLAALEHPVAQAAPKAPELKPAIAKLE